jgi:hypothetical protein
VFEGVNIVNDFVKNIMEDIIDPRTSLTLNSYILDELSFNLISICLTVLAD